MKNNSEIQNTIIAISKYSPYTIINLETLTNSLGKKLKVEKVFSLCRCGQSKMKPYCDGSHSEKGINGENTSGLSSNKIKEYQGRNITICDNRSICSHDGTCVKELAAVFHLEEKPWITPDGAGVKAIIETIEKCPSGALSYKLGKNHYNYIDREPGIYVSKNGPLHVKGFITLIDDQESSPASEEHYTLCRCGESKNQPFCDGSHLESDFKDDNN